MTGCMQPMTGGLLTEDPLRGAEAWKAVRRRKLRSITAKFPSAGASV